ncbi:MAG: hypothetical protein ACYCS7_04940 [Acidimicrobiales bacterium]
MSAAAAGMVVAMIPWTAYLAWSLPGHFRAQDWTIAWVGFDVVLIGVLVFAAWASWFERRILAPTAIVLATLLCVDAWFDVNTSFGTSGGILTILMALFFNLPLAGFFVLVARRIMLNSAAAIAAWQGQQPPPHVRDSPMLFGMTGLVSSPAEMSDELVLPPGAGGAEDAAPDGSG